jgi:hypothetical protein
MTYQASHIKRARRTKDQIRQLEDQIYDALEQDHPQSIRHIFYMMTNPRLPVPIDKTDAGYNQVQNRLTLMRRSGRISYDWISDSTRRGYHVPVYNSASDFVRSMSQHYRADMWQSTDTYVEVWAESRSVASVIQDDCEELAVSLYPCGGFSSITLAYDGARTINHFTDHGRKRAFIVYVGDYDPAGVIIDGSLEREIRKHLDPEIDLLFDRVAISEEQIDQYDLPTRKRKSGDRRSLHVKETVEAEAMPAWIMRDLVRTAIESFLPERMQKVAKVAEESEREFLRAMADLMEKTE